ncbi:MAG: biopolymer transporter ExbD [Cyclobacteriaceae bacterium]
MAKALPEIPNASMADIAFLLLTFFLVTTTMPNDKGLSMQLPPPPETQPEDVKIQERNMFKIQVNSNDALLVEGEPMEDVSGLKEMIKKFVLNNGADPKSSDSPDKAIVSFKTDRGTTHKRFVEILDIAQAAYYDIYADQAGVSNEEFRKIASDLNNPENQRIYNKGREGIPMAISIAEPSKVGN